ncbi:MAG TPA: MBL fold metallo-hydrolase [Syntrophomonadaceae bacterium]|nr:MBL fold metallo-hydrolase [Syntrophomonadaceae bacterium]
MKRFKMLCSGVYQVGGDGLSRGEDCSVYLLSSHGESALVDMGAGASAPLILENVQSCGVSLDSFRYLIVTHGHIDHIGGLEYIKKSLPEARIVAQRLELPAITEGRPELTAASWYGVAYRGVNVDLILDGPENLTLGDLTLTCLPTPGHTPGSMVLYSDIDGQRVLFGQDIHGPFQNEWGSDIKAWKESMEKLLQLNADMLCEGHFGVFSPASRVKSYIESYLKRYS